MKKARLEIDAPGCCDDCYFCKKQNGNYWCYVIKQNVDYADDNLPDGEWGDDDWEKKRHPDCPLKIVEDNQ